MRYEIKIKIQTGTSELRDIFHCFCFVDFYIYNPNGYNIIILCKYTFEKSIENIPLCVM